MSIEKSKMIKKRRRSKEKGWRAFGFWLGAYGRPFSNPALSPYVFPLFDLFSFSLFLQFPWLTINMTTSLQLLKRTLRKEMATRLKAVTADSINSQSDGVFKQLIELDEFKASKSISVYISMPTCEINTRAMIRYILEADKTCYIPRCTKNTMDMVKITSWEDYLSLPINKWDIPEPPLHQVRENALDVNGLDLILVPGVAFDSDRNRIGHGKGYYDRYLLKYQDWATRNNKPMVKTVALALQEQIVDLGTIPLEQTDQKLDHILTPLQKL
ncbi:hypothetical protein [Absidia glauca]|uniref:5-formyltetrahydrofolate cyclo-ligase n=1 Tax=Absidia glauca TaxID=4829 RepID=A0A163K902_ABSGL|nr:hypothetical protein [Absidia glauca]